MTTSYISKRKLAGSSFSLSSSRAIEREELVNLLRSIRRGECGVGLKICIESVEDPLINDPWLVVVYWKDEVESAMMMVVETSEMDETLRPCETPHWSCVETRVMPVIVQQVPF